MNASTTDTAPKPGSRLALLGFLCLVGVAVGFRLYDLDRRLMHGDEANQAIKAAMLLETGVYTYDPVEHHGPTIYYLSWLVESMLGRESRAEMTERSLRIIPAAFGIATVAVLWLLRNALGASATVFAALLMTLSPALTFYSRYYIQETLLVFFMIAAIACGWRYLRRPSAGWAIGFGAAIGLMHATKETAVIACAAMAVAMAGTFAATRQRPALPKPAHLAIATVSAMTASTLFFSSFGANPRGVLDSVLTYASYFGKGGEPSPHTHPWTFYLERLVWHHRGQGPNWTELFVLIAAVTGAGFAITSVRSSRQKSFSTPLPVFLTFFSLFILAVYSAIPYKTPWNLIQFHAPLCILGGIGLGALWNAAAPRIARIVIATIITIAAAHLGWLNVQTNFEYPEYPYNPYVYGHTSSAFHRLVDRIDAVAQTQPAADAMLIAVIQPDGDYWPLPWYLRAYPRVGYWTAIPDPLPDAVIFIVDPKLNPTMAERLGPRFTNETHALRPRILRSVYVTKLPE